MLNKNVGKVSELPSNIELSVLFIGLNIKPDKEYTLKQTLNPLQRFVRTEQEKESAEMQRQQKAQKSGEAEVARQQWQTKKWMRTGEPMPEDVIPQPGIIKSEVLGEALKDLSPETKFFMRIKNLKPIERKFLIEEYLKSKERNW